MRRLWIFIGTRPVGNAVQMGSLSLAAAMLLASLLVGCQCQRKLPSSPQQAEFNRVYSGAVSRTTENIYSFSYTSRAGQVDAIRVFASADSKDLHYPVIFVVRQQKGVLSWQVPLALRGLYQRTYKYQEVSRTLCPLEPEEEELSAEHSLFIDVASMAPANVHYQLLVTWAKHFTLETGETFNFSATPSQPQYFLYTFPVRVNSVVIRVEAEQAHPCTVVSVQDIVCPVYDLDHNVEFIGVYQSMTKQAAITVQRKDFPDGKFYIVFVVRPEDYACGGSFTTEEGKGNSSHTGEHRKDLRITVVPAVSESVYIHATLLSFLIFLMFYGGALLVTFTQYACAHRCTSADGVCGPDDEGANMVAAFHPIDSSGTEEGGYGAIEESSCRTPASHSSTPQDTARCRSYSDSSAEEDSDFDPVHNFDMNKDVARTKTFLYVSDLARKDSKSIRKKYQVYFWNILTISVFYALPVIQLVITYQTVVNVTGNQDICYYNFLCAHPLGVLSAFNNILSNAGYIMLGFLFLLIVLQRDMTYRRALEVKDIYATECGIPKHFGLFYAMAVALMMEGVLSACYHVCPNYSNFQFDTSFLYMIAGLCMLKLYQTRHPDINPRAYAVYAIFALVIFLAVLGVIFGKNATWFWILFSAVHVIASLALSTHIYYMGRLKIDVGVFKRIALVLYTDFIQQCNGPQYMDRMVLLILGNLVNWSFAIFGLILRPKDFASYLLGIFICNLLLYLAFYIIMKLRSLEKIRPIPSFCIIATAVLWAAALYFFFQNLTSWEETPAESRELNRDCSLLHFFDDHDIWHFLSATAMFFSFLVLLTLDDDLEFVRRDRILVF
ncbi:SID1 transmembrane family member 1 isoform X2 [Polypterus senegalus]|uniref:SID1 transmembrane family member 1 isoform X2 n=1 Tax=Polypterus senegalus TaxID=55291 RepID=UPI0019633FCA|nr:SID1 transmembrane family member 1 isoform X2 [Polypterus senegalus]